MTLSAFVLGFSIYGLWSGSCVLDLLQRWILIATKSNTNKESIIKLKSWTIPLSGMTAEKGVLHRRLRLLYVAYRAELQKV